MPSLMKSSLVGIFLCALLSGCAELPVNIAYLYQSHFLLLHKDGMAIKPPDRSTVVEEPDATIDFTQTYGAIDDQPHVGNSIRAGIDRYILERKEHQPKANCGSTGTIHLLIIVHGGMNDDLTSAKHMLDLMYPPLSAPEESTTLPPLRTMPQEPTLLNETCYYPVFLNWDSDMLDSMADDLVRIRFGEDDARFAVPTFPLMLGGRLLSGIAGMPSSLVHNGITIKDTFVGSHEVGDPFGAALGDAFLYFPLNVLYTVGIPIGEGLGCPAWNIMKRRVDLAVANYLDGDQKSISGGFRTLLKNLKTWIRQDGKQWYWGQTKLPVTVTLVGHSMGTMILNRLLTETEDESPSHVPALSLPIRRIIYLAPAASINETEALLMPYLKRHAGTEFWLFTLNRRDESREYDWRKGSIMFPRGSLLTWIDTFLETETDPGQATLGWVKNLQSYYPVDPVSPPYSIGMKEYFFPESSIPLSPWQKLNVHWHLEHSERAQAFQSTRRVWSDAAPGEHGDFLKPQYFSQVLCQVDASLMPVRTCPR